VAVDSGLVGYGVVERDAAVGGVGFEVRGVVRGDRDGDSAVGGAEVEAVSLPRGTVEGRVDGAVGGADLDVASEVVDGDSAVGGFAVEGAFDCGERDAAVQGLELRGEMVGNVEFVAYGPVAVAGDLRAVGLDGGAGVDGDLVEDRVGVGLAGGADADAGFEGDVLAVFADDFDAAVLAVDAEMSADEGEGGGAEFAGLLAAVEETGDYAVVVGVVAAGVGGEGLGVECGGRGQGGAGDKGVGAHENLLRYWEEIRAMGGCGSVLLRAGRGFRGGVDGPRT